MKKKYIQENIEQNIIKRSSRGFILPFTMLICAIVLAISTGISTILAKEVYFSRLSRQSQIAYFAADNGMTCVINVDDAYLDANGIGIFPYQDPVLTDPTSYMVGVLSDANNVRAINGLAPIASLDDIKCATSDIFDALVTQFTVTPYSRVNTSSFPPVTERGATTRFSMKMDQGDGTQKCADIEVNKTITYRQIISKGYASCFSSISNPVERAIINTTE